MMDSFLTSAALSLTKDTRGDGGIHPTRGFAFEPAIVIAGSAEDEMHKKAGPTAAWTRLEAMALGLGLPGVEKATSWGHPALKAHGKLWVWCSPHEDAFVFKTSFEEREILI